ncbi:Uncharacterized protein APZ42_013970 [Daphnia magna]|uniref:Uncharacterized protein n=1 Tax=Daphnia magna TaxID=35525 RepID=A0A162QBF8_9CRUS|nr:Uncharacterized protein APZ42_013970 [Daphnia magna]
MVDLNFTTILGTKGYQTGVMWLKM